MEVSYFMASKIKNIQEVKIPDAYILEQSAAIPEIDSFALALRHKKSGARVFLKRKANRIPYKRVLDQCDSLLVYRLPS